MIIKDQLLREIIIPNALTRIVSLVPSQTEFLYELGLGTQIVGQTLFCIHPQENFKKATKIGGTKKLNLHKIRALKPDIIIANKEENEKQQIDELAKEFPVWISDIETLKDAMEMMLAIGNIFNKTSEANAIIHKIETQFAEFKVSNTGKKKTVLYFIWKQPWMAAGRKTYINEMLEIAGFENAIKEKDSRYPKLFMEDITSINPDYIFLSTEPFPFNKQNVKEFSNLFPASKVCLVDGEMFSWYGSRLLLAPAYFKDLLEY